VCKHFLAREAPIPGRRKTVQALPQTWTLLNRKLNEGELFKAGTSSRVQEEVPITTFDGCWSVVATIRRTSNGPPPRCPGENGVEPAIRPLLAITCSDVQNSYDSVRTPLTRSPKMPLASVRRVLRGSPASRYPPSFNRTTEWRPSCGCTGSVNWPFPKSRAQGIAIARKLPQSVVTRWPSLRKSMNSFAFASRGRRSNVVRKSLFHLLTL
jgi:hypothetical protein